MLNTDLSKINSILVSTIPEVGAVVRIVTFFVANSVGQKVNSVIWIVSFSKVTMFLGSCYTSQNEEKSPKNHN